MIAGLLYAEKDFTSAESYYDWNSIMQDLGLKTLFQASCADVVWKNGKVLYQGVEDGFLGDTLKKVMRVPLKSSREILYRQAVLKDCMGAEGFLNDLYDMTGKFLKEREELVRRTENQKNGVAVGGLATQVELMRMQVEGLLKIKKIFAEWGNDIFSEAFVSLRDRLDKDFNEEKEKQIRKILADLRFCVDTLEERVSWTSWQKCFPGIVMECGFGEDLKFVDLRLDSLFTDVRKHGDLVDIALKGQLRKGKMLLTPGKLDLEENETLREQGSQLETEVVRYVVECCNAWFNSYSQFFDQLHFQTGFYRAALNLMHQMKRYDIRYCMPAPVSQDRLQFKGLKEVVMTMEQKGNTIANSCKMNGQMLMVVTGANQGGKSTFLRSIGIAQVMMQCGLMVAADQYESGIFPDFFTHFTRREDSAMNSGRLDEELKRMDQIIRHLGSHPMILLNESFATTTEIEGSDIMYDIVSALNEQGVKILTVTHLLSFAQKLYQEKGPDGDAQFLSAQRLPDGQRTYKMVPHEPEMTSFGLDLYAKIVEKK